LKSVNGDTPIVVSDVTRALANANGQQLQLILGVNYRSKNSKTFLRRCEKVLIVV